jgi:hypothetical protein
MGEKGEPLSKCLIYFGGTKGILPTAAEMTAVGNRYAVEADATVI